MSVLGMDADGDVRTAFEFKDIFEKTGASRCPYRCPFCETPYVDKCISTACKKAPHFSLPPGTLHQNGCDGEGEPDRALRVAIDVDDPKRIVVGDVEFPEALVAARRERGRFKRRIDGIAPSPQETAERRKRVDTSAMMASKYTSSLLRTFVMAHRALRTIASQIAAAVGQPGSAEYKATYRDVMQSRRLELYGERLTYGSAFYNSNLAPAATPRIYQGIGMVKRMEMELVIEDRSAWPRAYQSTQRVQLFIVADAVLPVDSPRTHAELLEALEKAVASGATVSWHAYGLARLTENDEFVLRLETLDHLCLV